MIPTFQGKHNAVKVRIWTILLDRYIRGLGGLTLRELVDHTGLPYGSLSSLLCRWREWGYVGARKRPRGFEYRLRERGRAWLERWAWLIPQQGG